MRANGIRGGAIAFVAALLSGGFATARAAAAPEGLLYVGVYGANEIAIFPRSHSRTQIGTITRGIVGPGALATDKNGTLYVANGNNTITAYPIGAAAPSLTIRQGVNGPAYLATGPDGSLYVSNTGSKTVEQFPAGSVVPSRTITLPQAPAGVAVDRGGDLFVVTGTDIERFKPGETTGSSLGLSLPEDGQDLAVDRHGNFLVDLEDFGALLFAHAKPHAQIGTFGFLYTQQGRFALAANDDGLYLVDGSEGRVVQIAYPYFNFANVIGGLSGSINGVAVTPRIQP